MRYQKQISLLLSVVMLFSLIQLGTMQASAAEVPSMQFSFSNPKIILYKGDKDNQYVAPKGEFSIQWRSVSGADHYSVSAKKLDAWPATEPTDDEKGESIYNHHSTTSCSITVPESEQTVSKWLKYYVAAIDSNGKMLAQGTVYIIITSPSLQYTSHNDKDHVDYKDLTIEWRSVSGTAYYEVTAKLLDGEPTDEYTEDEPGRFLYEKDRTTNTYFRIGVEKLQASKWIKYYVAARDSSGSGYALAQGSIYLYIEEPTYTVRYNANGGSGAPSSQTKTEGRALTLRSGLPTKSYRITYNANGGSVSPSSKTVSCTFEGWNTNSRGTGTSYDPGDRYTTDADVTLYAQWTDPTAGSLAEPTWTDHEFAGWYTSANGGSRVTSATTITEDMTIYAHWSTGYTIQYDANGGTGAPEAQTKNAGETLTLRTGIPTKTYTITYNANGGSVSPSSKTVDCTFRNWNTSADGRGTTYNSGARYSADDDVTLYAQWTNPSAGTLVTPTRQNHSFDGWYTSASGGSRVTETTTVTGDMTLYAHWSTGYQVNYDANGGTGAPARQTKTRGVDLTLSTVRPARSYTVTFNANGGSVSPASKRADCAFKNWNTEANGSGTFYRAGAQYTEDADVTLYAQWTNPTMGALPEPAPPASQPDASFAGWYTSAAGGDRVTESTAVTGNMTVYAHWETYHTVTYDANGGTGAPEPQEKINGVDLTLSTVRPAKSYTVTFNANGGSVSPASKRVDCAFKNWNTEANGSGTFYRAGYPYTEDADITLYAQWTNPTMGALPEPSSPNPNNSFAGWFTAADGGEQVTESTAVAGNMTIYAHWIADYTVSYNANGGEYAAGDQTKTAGTPLTLRTEKPTKTYTVTLDANGGSVSPASKTVECTFRYWNTEPNGGGTLYRAGARYTADADVTLYAQWTNPTLGELPEQPVRDGYVFAGWFTAAEDGSPVTEATTLTGDMTVYAHWRLIQDTVSGDCGANGKNLQWELNRNTGKLTITGSGDMPNWLTSNNVPPWFEWKDEITSVEIGEGATSIGSSAFCYCGNLRSITIPDSVNSIGRYAFYRCGSLDNVVIPNGVKTIGNYTFHDCEGLTNIRLPEGLTGIGEQAFYNCVGLRSVTIPDSVESIGSAAFYGCTGLEEIHLPKSLGKLETVVFLGCRSLKSIEIPNGVTSIGNSAFSGCLELTDVIIPDSVTSIGDTAFANCRKLDHIDIPNSVTSIGNYAFNSCYDLVSVTVPESVTHIGDCAFYANRNMTGITILNPACEITGDKALGNPGTAVVYGQAGSTAEAYANQFGYQFASDYTVFFHANGGTGAPEAQTKAKGVDLTLSAVRPAKSFTVTFNANGGSVSPAARTVSCTFRNWNTAANGSGTFYRAGDAYTADAAVTLYAQWTNPALGELPAPVWDDRSFEGWYTAGGNKVDASTTVTGDMTLYAHWEDHPNYIVSYSANGGTYAPPAQTKTQGAALTLSAEAPAKTYTITYHPNGGSVSPSSKTVDCTFRNWNTSASGGGAAYDPGARYTADADLALYAQWTDPTVGALPTPEWNGHDFCGWFTTANGGAAVTYSTAVTGDMTVYALWDASGQCGPDLTWRFDAGTGRLTITGSGEMYDWDEANPAPWYQYAEAITRLSLPDGLTRIGNYAFRGCSGLTGVMLPDSVESIEAFAFRDCTGLKGITAWKKVRSIEIGAFQNCKSLKKMTVKNPDPKCYAYLDETTLGVKETTVIYCAERSGAWDYARLFKFEYKLLFGDVPDEAYYARPVAWAVDNDVTNGTSDTTFSPNATCTRAQVVTFLWRASGSPEPARSSSPFTDVQSGAYYYKAVLWAVENGITNGVSADTFGPELGCTRGQVVTFLWRASGQPKPKTAASPFGDVKAGAYYYEPVLWAVENGITNGTGPDKFSPDATCTRAQIVTFLYRSMNGQT